MEASQPRSACDACSTATPGSVYCGTPMPATTLRSSRPSAPAWRAPLRPGCSCSRFHGLEQRCIDGETAVGFRLEIARDARCHGCLQRADRVDLNLRCAHALDPDVEYKV